MKQPTSLLRSVVEGYIFSHTMSPITAADSQTEQPVSEINNNEISLFPENITYPHRTTDTVLESENDLQDTKNWRRPDSMLVLKKRVVFRP